MRIHRVLIVTALLAVTIGCVSQIPIPENHALSYQGVLRASHHWDLLAADVASEIRKSTSPNRAMYVAPPADNSEFSRALHSLVTTQIVNTGARVVTAPQAALTVRIETQVVAHRSRRVAYQPGTLTAIAAGLAVARNAALHWSEDAQAVAALALVGAVDAATAYSAGRAPHTEVIVTTSLVDGPFLVARKTDIYYIQEADAFLFMEPPPPTLPPPGPLLRDMRVTGDPR